MNKRLLQKRLAVLTAAALVLGTGVVTAKSYVFKPAHAQCVGVGNPGAGNPGNDRAVGNAGDQPRGGGNGGSITGDRGNSR